MGEQTIKIGTPKMQQAVNPQHNKQVRVFSPNFETRLVSFCWGCVASLVCWGATFAKGCSATDALCPLGSDTGNSVLLEFILEHNNMNVVKIKLRNLMVIGTPFSDM